MRVNILGVGISATNMKEAVSQIENAVDQGKQGYVCAQGVHGIMEAQSDAGLKRAFNHSLLTVPDGMPTVWWGRLSGHSTMRRVFGPDLMLEIMRSGVARGRTHFLFGGEPGVAETLKASLEKRIPGVKIVGISTPPFRPLNAEEEMALKAQLDQLKPDYFWVGISTPKQDRFMAQYSGKLNTKIMFGVGAAFDYHSGRIKDAPDWVKTIGMQWFHRMLQDPKRLWKRYMINNPKFIALAATQILRLKKF